MPWDFLSHSEAGTYLARTNVPEDDGGARCRSEVQLPKTDMIGNAEWQALSYFSNFMVLGEKLTIASGRRRV